MWVAAYAYISEIGPVTKKVSQRIIKQVDVWKRLPIGFFDGAACNNVCGCVLYVVIESGSYFHFSWNCGEGTNNCAEIIALWGYCSVLNGFQLSP